MDPRELTNAMIREFDKALALDPEARKIRRKADEGSATYVDAGNYGAAAGRAVGKVIIRNMQELYPEGRIPRLEVSPILLPLLEHEHDVICNITEKVQTTMNQKAGIVLKAIRPQFNKERADELIRVLSDGSFEDGFTW